MGATADPLKKQYPNADNKRPKRTAQRAREFPEKNRQKKKTRHTPTKAGCAG